MRASLPLVILLGSRVEIEGEMEERSRRLGAGERQVARLVIEADGARGEGGRHRHTVDAVEQRVEPLGHEHPARELHQPPRGSPLHLEPEAVSGEESDQTQTEKSGQQIAQHQAPGARPRPGQSERA